jgi:hypothetical protein
MICRADHNPVCTPTAVVRASVQKTVGYYRKELPHTGDLEMWMRFAVYGSVGVLDSDQAYWRQHDENMRVQYQGPDDLRHHKAAYDSIFGKHGGLIPDAERLRGISARRLSEAAFWKGHDCFEAGSAAQCDEYLHVARECDPGICSSRSWARLRVKRAIGPRLWSLVDRARQWGSRAGRKTISPGASGSGNGQRSRWIA